MRQYFSNVVPIFPDPVLYTPDFAYMDKMLQRKEQQYNQGFSKLANQWALISRPVTNPENAKIRDAFLKQAKEGLKNLSTLDLSEYQNVENAMNVFAPYVNNENLIGDQTLTQFFNDQEQLAESYRNKDGGKYFSEDNLNEIRQQRYNFSKANPSEWKNYYSGKRPYTPYYDTADEYTKAMEKFKPSSVTTINKDGYYITTITDKSWYKEDIQRYLDGVLSSKAKNQWAIEARVRLNNNPDGVKNLYLQQSKQRLPAIDKELDNIDINLIKAKTPQDKAALEQNKIYFTNLKKELSDNISKIEKGDPNFVKQNLESFSKSVYINGIIDKLANSYSHKDIDRKLDFDDVLLTMYREQQANYRARLKKKEEEEEQQGPLSVAVPIMEDDKDKPDSYDALLEKEKALQKSLDIKHNEIQAHIKNSYNLKNVTEKDFRDFLAKNPNNSLTQQYFQIYNDKQAISGKYKRGLEEAKKWAIDQIGEEEYNKYIKWKDQKNLNVKQIVGQTSAEVKFSGDLGGNKLSYENNTWLLKDPSGKVIADKGKHYMDKHMGKSAYDYDIERSRMVSSKISTNTTGIQGEKIEEAYNAHVRNYLSTKRDDINLQAKGNAYSEGRSGFKSKRTVISGISNLSTGDITNFTIVPKSNNLDIIFKVKEEDKLDKTKYDAIKRQIEGNLAGTGATVSEYNEKDKSFRIRNWGRGIKEFEDDDYYGKIDPMLHTQIGELLEWRGNSPDMTKTVTLGVKDKGGKNRVFQIKKITGYSQENDSYMLLNPKNGTNLDPNSVYNNIVVPYSTMVQLLNMDSDKLDAVLESLAK